MQQLFLRTHWLTQSLMLIVPVQAVEKLPAQSLVVIASVDRHNWRSLRPTDQSPPEPV
jgi:hypothetical protein